jgi:hypothetical protein
LGLVDGLESWSLAVAGNIHLGQQQHKNNNNYFTTPDHNSEETILI